MSDLEELLSEARAELWAVYVRPVLEQRLWVCELCGHRLRMEEHRPECLFTRLDKALEAYDKKLKETRDD